MPNRISLVFELDKSEDKGRIRHNTLCSYGYSNDQLRQAEEIVIGTGVSSVHDDEYLARVLEDPTHVNAIELGLAYTPGAFSDCTKWGLSVQRLSITTPEAIDAFGVKKAAKAPPEKPRKYYGYVVGLTEALRSKTSLVSDQRLFGVFATPLDDVPAHADVYAVSSAREDKETIKAYLWDIFNLDQLSESIAS
jgi:hypothetical protein